ncbi:MAG: LytTR family DNA-binding domain-containing protein [Crocinitomicaceae bacterium]|nr:LytTR family DNA-binding domain-containing protein [Crocinitomicaceae bacterium]MDG1777259.1 LytTR family DNA-binding domain-containing protein [Crocinitomicaceae bacterium]
MKQFKTILIDDERLAREDLKRILIDYPEIEVIDQAKNGIEGIEKIKALQPDLIFLDVNMPGMTGFEMLRQLPEIPHVIFVTAYDEYALKAFEVDALDYILKPVDTARLSEAIEKLMQKNNEDFESDSTQEAIPIERKLTQEDKVFIKDGEKCYFVTLKDVRMLESDGNYVKIHFDKNRLLTLRSLNSFEDRLDPECFFRANRKFIINLNWVDKVENWFNGGLQVELRTGEKVEISRRQAIRFKDRFSL